MAGGDESIIYYHSYWKLDSDEVEISEVTDHWARKTAYMLQKGLAYRDEGDHRDKFTDLMYENLVSNHMGQLAKIYERYNGISRTLGEKFQTTASENPQGKYGIHEYKLTDFGLNKEDLMQKNASYFKLFNKLKSADQKKSYHAR